jgi:arylsulfate sulfotransferase
MYYYDANGVIRGEIPVLYYRSHRLLFDNDGIMWFSASTKHFVGMNRLGKLVKIINLGDQYILHNDYALDSDGNIVSLATDLKHSDHAVQDQVIKVDTDSGEVSLLVDFGDLFPDYKQSTDHSGIDESDPTATNRWDWIHFNTIQLMDDGSALLSARETSTMIKINDIEGTPSLDYMIGEPSVWNGMDAQPSFLTKVGDSGDTGGQHSITVQYDSSLEDGQYYIYMFDNDFGYAMTRPDFDWTMIDGISTAQSSKDENSNSQFRKYLVDENAGTYTEVQDFDVPYSPYVSSAQELSDDLNLVDIGMQGLFGVYDDDGNLKAQYKMVLSSGYIYRVYQYGFRGFYFA